MDIKTEEMHQAVIHDEHYDVAENCIEPIASVHWEKFLRDEKPLNGYIYSVKCLGNLEGKRIIDIGCGTGGFSIILAKLGAHVEGCDISPKAVEIARRKAHVNNVADRATFNVKSFYGLDYHEEYFDFAIGQNILHHVQDKSALAGPLYRILRKEGKAVFFEPFGGSAWLDRIRLLAPVPINDIEGDNLDDKIKYSDLEPFKKFFDLTCTEFQIFSRLERVLKNKSVIGRLGVLDEFLLKRVPFFRKFARNIVIEMKKR